MQIRNININQKVFIVAEIGNNHEGDFSLAKELILLAAKAGVDAVKFQTFLPESLFGGDEARLKRLKQFQFSHKQFTELSELANSLGIIFFFNPF